MNCLFVKKWEESTFPLNMLRAFLTVVLLLLTVLAGHAPAAGLVGKRVLVVMSYHPGFAWHEETKEGIDLALKGATLRYFYLDTKNNLAEGAANAEKAFQIYQEFKPDAVIAADDNAQSLFVVPFLKNQVPTPVVFCGVNNDASKYGYPADNVTGIVEKKHYRESISFAQLIVPGLKKAAVIYRDTPSNRTNVAQIKGEMADYKVAIVSFLKVETLADMEKGLAAIADQADLLIVLNLSGITDSHKKSIEGKQAISHLKPFWHKPTIGVSSWEIEAGLLCAVAKTGQEQGVTAGHMVIDLIGGKPMASMPITQNRNGQRIINVSTARELGITLRRIALINSELVK